MDQSQRLGLGLWFPENVSSRAMLNSEYRAGVWLKDDRQASSNTKGYLGGTFDRNLSALEQEGLCAASRRAKRMQVDLRVQLYNLKWALSDALAALVRKLAALLGMERSEARSRSEHQEKAREKCTEGVLIALKRKKQWRTSRVTARCSSECICRGSACAGPLPQGSLSVEAFTSQAVPTRLQHRQGFSCE